MLAATRRGELYRLWKKFKDRKLKIRANGLPTEGALSAVLSPPQMEAALDVALERFLCEEQSKALRTSVNVGMSLAEYERRAADAVIAVALASGAVPGGGVDEDLLRRVGVPMIEQTAISALAVNFADADIGRAALLRRIWTKIQTFFKCKGPRCGGKGSSGGKDDGHYNDIYFPNW
jgi:hypothetical protein